MSGNAPLYDRSAAAFSHTERSADDWQESANDAEASKQIEHDQKQAGYVPEPLEPLPADYFDTQPF